MNLCKWKISERHLSFNKLHTFIYTISYLLKIMQLCYIKTVLDNLEYTVVMSMVGQMFQCQG